MSRRTNIDDWLLSVPLPNQVGDFKTVHFDSFVEYQRQKGLDLIRLGCDIIDHAIEIIHAFYDKLGILAVFPLGASEGVLTWDDRYFDNVGMPNEPPSLYILPSLDIFDLDDEEYRCPLIMANKTVHKQKAFYRCYRDKEFICNNWKYNRGIYVYAPTGSQS